MTRLYRLKQVQLLNLNLNIVYSVHSNNRNMYTNRRLKWMGYSILTLKPALHVICACLCILFHRDQSRKGLYRKGKVQSGRV